MRREHRLRDGATLEVLEAVPAGGGGGTGRQQPLVFLHGSYHAAWAFENFLEQFSARGYPCYAPSFRGHGSSAPPRTPGDPLEGTLEGHAADVVDFIENGIAGGAPPVLVGHSFGGLIAQKVAVCEANRTAAGRKPPGRLNKLAGLALLNSVPPKGNGGMTTRFLLTRPLDAWRVTMGFIRKTFEDSQDECRYLFFSGDLPDVDLERYRGLISASAQPGAKLLDLRKLNGSLPIPAAPSTMPPVLVLGSANDNVVDREGVLETAAHFGVAPVILEASAHDSMLDTRWQEAATELERFLEASSKKSLHVGR